MGLQWQETSITEDLLLEVGLRFGADIEIVPYTQNQEAMTGADWRWEWLLEGETAWFAMLVQAKKLKPMAGGQYGYDFGYPAGAAGRPQVEVLLDYAAANELAPVYALYNGPDLEVDGQWSCPMLEPARPLMGVSLLAAETAQYRTNFVSDHRRVPQQDVTRWASPFACLALCESWYPCSWWPPDRWTPPDLGFPDETPNTDIAFRAAVAVEILRARPAAAQFRERVAVGRVAGVHLSLPEAIEGRLQAARQGDIGDVDDGGPVGAGVLHGRDRDDESGS